MNSPKLASILVSVFSLTACGVDTQNEASSIKSGPIQANSLLKCESQTSDRTYKVFGEFSQSPSISYTSGGVIASPLGLESKSIAFGHPATIRTTFSNNSFSMTVSERLGSLSFVQGSHSGSCVRVAVPVPTPVPVLENQAEEFQCGGHLNVTFGSDFHTNMPGSAGTHRSVQMKGKIPLPPRTAIGPNGQIVVLPVFGYIPVDAKTSLDLTARGQENKWTEYKGMIKSMNTVWSQDNDLGTATVEFTQASGEPLKMDCKKIVRIPVAAGQ